ncbi:MAG TPA: hypothetical protein ENO23_03145 [Alphaproteobacteria bacterium]|nr:hypothetical protein [Alphaproteobacteria bacterium]
MERLVGRALFDDDFRARLLDDPARVAETLDIDLSYDEVERLREVNRHVVDRIAEDFQREVARSGEVERLGLW